MSLNRNNLLGFAAFAAAVLCSALKGKGERAPREKKSGDGDRERIEGLRERREERKSAGQGGREKERGGRGGVLKADGPVKRPLSKTSFLPFSGGARSLIPLNVSPDHIDRSTAVSHQSSAFKVRNYEGGKTRP